ncbi:MaoC family dehydratase [Desulforhopalus singaporensis]|uniref:Acyl dehydratase n=1 Tax=Desulforhopalus singaporensis TaxID=91360 RepID=A0A1H0V0H0_9BACT|nr:MaoC family dehydratase [Desulforhopalus singaporensis]SDP71795.1 Acyl dehydratase [Desulforhopalus singaporensis]
MAAVEFNSFETFKQKKDAPLPKGKWVTVTREMVNAFAEATHDHQWIHTDPERARQESFFGMAVAHGFLSLSLVPGMIRDVVESSSKKIEVNYGLNRVRFPAPVPVGSRVRLSCRIGEVKEMENSGLKVTWHCEVEIENNDKPVCVCELIVLMFE